MKLYREPLDSEARGCSQRLRVGIREGLRYGSSCVGACGLLMCILFVSGLMNLPPMAALAIWLAAQKILPSSAFLARAPGAALIGWGAGSWFAQ